MSALKSYHHFELQIFLFHIDSDFLFSDNWRVIFSDEPPIFQNKSYVVDNFPHLISLASRI